MTARRSRYLPASMPSDLVDKGQGLGCKGQGLGWTKARV